MQIQRPNLSRSVVANPHPWIHPRLSPLPRIPFANVPTPLESLARLSAELGGPEIYIKRDDLTGLATGGNKTRKLEYLIADALERKADCVITAGAPQSNHCRQTAAAAARTGLQCHLVFGGSKDSPLIGNLLLDKLLGATGHWTEKAAREAKMTTLAAELRAQGRSPYVIPVGGSNGLGAIGYVAAVCELAHQASASGLSFDHIVFATSSGATQAGLVVGMKLAGMTGQLQAISIDQTSEEDGYRKFVFDIATETGKILDTEFDLTLDDFDINCDYLGEGYGVVGPPEREAITMLARTEGILVDPVYSGRALAGLISLVRKGAFRESDRVLFWHTGGESALHAYAADI